MSVIYDEAFVMYKASRSVDIAMFYCPYIPGMSAEQLLEVQEQIAARRGPTELQQQIMDVVRTQPQK